MVKVQAKLSDPQAPKSLGRRKNQTQPYQKGGKKRWACDLYQARKRKPDPLGPGSQPNQQTQQKLNEERNGGHNISVNC